jgi:hypothetical protein
MLHVTETALGQLLHHCLELSLPLAQQGALASGTDANNLICLAQRRIIPTISAIVVRGIPPSCLVS